MTDSRRDERAASWRNWANTERSMPVIEIAPREVEQVQLAIERARETGHTVKPIGASHSFTGVGATDGIRLNLSRLRGLVSADTETGRVTLWGGTHLWEIPAILGPLGLAIQNLGDIDRQTITGATQTGTHGTGLGFGGISTGIVGATIVTGTGEVLTVSESENAEMLPAVALGLGTLGVLVTVTLQCVPRFLLNAEEAPLPIDEAIDSYVDRSRAADHYEFFWFPYGKVVRTKTNTRLPLDHERRPLGKVARYIDEELVNNQLFGAICGLQRVFPGIGPSVNRTISAISSRRSYTDESHRVLITSRRVRFREMEYSVPFEQVPEVMRELRAMIERRRFNISFPIEVRSAAADQLMMSTAHGRDSGYIAVHRYWTEKDTEYFREAEAIFKAHEGRPHWGKMNTLTRDEVRERYPRFDDFVALRDRLDPERVFANPYLDRVLGK